MPRRVSSARTDSPPEEAMRAAVGHGFKQPLVVGERPIPSTQAPAVRGTKGQLAVVANQLTKRFGERTAFSEVSFEVAYGEVFGFLGPNGAGKTTTVRTLGTLIAPTSGSATVAGIPLSSEHGVEIRERISIMPEAPG